MVMPPGSTRVAVAAYSSEVGKSARIEISMHIGFFFNDYAGCQAPHAAPFAFGPSRIQPGLEGGIVCSIAKERAMAEAIDGRYPGYGCRFQRLSPGPVLWPADNDNPQVDYTPHFDECVSSWKASTICPGHIIGGRPAVAEPAAAAG